MKELKKKISDLIQSKFYSKLQQTTNKPRHERKLMKVTKCSKTGSCHMTVVLELQSRKVRMYTIYLHVYNGKLTRFF